MNIPPSNFFLPFAAITLLGALLTLWMRSLVQAALSLVLCFIGISGLYLLLANPVAAMLQIIVYSGAIVILVLFVIMMLNEHREEASTRKHRIQFWLSLLLLGLLALGSVKLLSGSAITKSLAAGSIALPSTTQIMTLERIGQHIFKEHLLAFEVTGLILLSAMIAAITLVKREL